MEIIIIPKRIRESYPDLKAVNIIAGKVRYCPYHKKCDKVNPNYNGFTAVIVKILNKLGIYVEKEQVVCPEQRRCAIRNKID